MQKLRRRFLFAGLAAILTAPGAARAQNLVEGAIRIVPNASDYERREIDGRLFYISLHFRVIDKALLQHCLEYIPAKLRDLATIVPPAAWKKIAQVPIWLEYDDPLCPGSCYWDSRRWLAKHGSLLDKAGAVQLNKDVWLWRDKQPTLVMHELAHAYHQQVLTYDDPSIREAYRQAVASGKYDHVRRNSGEVGPAYALTNYKEFFAELTEAYFGENDYEPHTRTELKRLDPQSYAVIEAAWNRP